MNIEHLQHNLKPDKVGCLIIDPLAPNGYRRKVRRGWSVKLNGLDRDFVVHKDLDFPSSFAVSDKITGLAVPYLQWAMPSTTEEAIEAANARMKTVTPEGFEAILKASIKKYNITDI